MGPKVRAIIAATGGAIGVLCGWGGMYAMELVPDGICGIVPGLAAADLIQKAWQLAYTGERDLAMDLFQGILPQLVFALQNLELWLFMEKRLLAARGVIPESSAHTRRASRVPDSSALRHITWLNHRLLKQLDQLGLPRNPEPA